MRHLFLLALLTGLAAAASAQTPATATSSLASARYSQADTLRAVQHLFQRRIRGGLGMADAGSATLTKGAVAMAFRNDSTSEARRIESNQDMLFGTAVLSYGVFQARRFGRGRYEQIVAAYAQGEPLPEYVRRRLRPRYFRYRPF